MSEYQAGCNRVVQVRKRDCRRFTADRKKLFLKWFAATANAAESARQAEVGYSTVYDHRMSDARFAEAWDRALEQSYARLEAKMVEMRFDTAAGAPIEVDGSFEPPDADVVDPVLALQLLQQHKAGVTRIRADRALRENPRGRGRVKELPSYERERLASDAEMERALVRGLRAFAVRVTKEDLAGGAASPSPRPSPSGGEGEAADPSTIPSSGNGPPPPAELGEE